MPTHKQTPSLSQTQNHKAQLANAYNELGKELSSAKLRVVGNYTLGRVIGEGAYGKVRIGTHRLTSTRVAIKQIPKAMSASLTREIHHHRQLHHPHITQMYEVIATESHIWIVTELCCGGELFDYLVEKGRLSEDETRVIFGQLCLAVDYLHNNNIVHRDLKLENVLLDERCRVKLGDFGFTREFERGTLMETFCGTTGYASPEMLQAKKYQGPEVDVWSLGIILYCLLTGTLPFDDDDEDVMRSKIIQGEFEDPVWLSLESRDLIKNILVKDVGDRFTIPQILAHPWFTSNKLTYEAESPISAMPMFPSDRPATPEDESRHATDSSQASTKDSFSPFRQNPDLISSTPTTPAESLHDPFESTENIMTTNELSIHRLASSSTIRKMSASDLESVASKLKTGDRQPATVMEEERDELPKRHTPSPLIWSSKAPPSYPVRTPARTKRRSVSSILSESASPTADKTPTPRPIPTARDLDFQTLLSARTPVMFSTPPERHLLSTLALLGFDTAQIVHSVLSNACDASGALWWMLHRKEEKAILEHHEQGTAAPLVARRRRSGGTRCRPGRRRTTRTRQGSRTWPVPRALAPRFALVPPTPTFAARPSTPPRAGGSLKDNGRRGARRGRQCEHHAACDDGAGGCGLVRKKSSEAVREEKERERRGSGRGIRRGRGGERGSGGSGDEPRSSHGSGASSKLTKSPPLKPAKDHGPVPTTPPPNEAAHGTAAQMGSPESLSQPGTTSAATPIPVKGEMLHSYSTPNFSETGQRSLWLQAPAGRARTSSLRLGCGSTKTGKQTEGRLRKHGRPPPSAGRRGSVSGGKFGSRAAPRTHRPSVHPDAALFGSHTPNSERGEHSSRPSSIHSISMQPRHRKSPSQSSAGSVHLRTASPMQKYHRRAGSGSSSTTRVVRQIAPVGRAPGAAHARSNSAASSVHSAPSSRPTSWYEPSESEGAPMRTASPYKSRARRSVEEGGARGRPRIRGAGSVGRSSWKKSWGMEPPGWSSRTAHVPIEVLAISPATEPTSIRDVFSGKTGYLAAAGDESDWVDEDDDIPLFVGGWFQLQAEPITLSPAPRGHRSASSSNSKRAGRNVGGGGGNGSSGSGGGGGRQKAGGHSPAERASPLPPDTGYDSSESRPGRRTLPAARSGPAFKHAIQEEDEGEEE
ncbi:Pkinase-domain-containing protein [Pholiota molesta]|nr:Pkinase-domain-containing protein [Pholiota molesta]